MNDEEKMAIIRLNQIILDAQRVIQNAGTMQEVWNALYVPPEIKYVPSDVAHEPHEVTYPRGRGNNG